MTAAEQLRLVALPHRNGGYSPWRSPARPGKGETTYELFRDGEHVLVLGKLQTGITDQDLAVFWAKALYRLRRYGLAEEQRRKIAGQLLRAGAPLPQSADWPGASRPGWSEVSAELAGLLSSA